MNLWFPVIRLPIVLTFVIALVIHAQIPVSLLHLLSFLALLHPHLGGDFKSAVHIASNSHCVSFAAVPLTF